jgi:pimeloyl-ACP methyl ester carboxylesterase
MQTLSVNRQGTKGPHLVMLHGWANSHKQLLSLGQILSEKAQVHLIDLPGFGNSKIPPPHFGSNDYAKQIIDYLDREGIKKAIFLGHSFGGKISATLAANWPDRIQQLILIGSSGLQRKKTLKMVSIKWLARMCKQWDLLTKKKTFETFFVPRFASKDWKEAGPMRAILVRSVNEEISSLFKKIQAPTLLLWGALDQETPLEMGERIHAMIPDSRLIAYPQAGHHPFENVGAHLVARHVCQFIEMGLS